MSPTLSTQEPTSHVKLRNISINTDTRSLGTQNVSLNSPKSVAHSSNKYKCADMERYNCPALTMDGDSAQELLGSVTTFTPAGDHETGHALRTSARVIHKMRMDLIRPPTPPPPEKKDPHKDDRLLPKTPNQARAIKSVWSNNEKNIFFEAVCEYGRDFESIVTMINNRMRRKSPTDVDYKTKDSVMRFYNQIFQKLSKYLQFSDEISKIAKELYALINYGEMRKKLAFISDKCYLKLSDLVYKGSVTIREKGKNIKIKTPSCRALRKLNELEEWQEEIKLPPRIDVILRPANVAAWGKVQTLAQNPRIKINMPLQKRVAGLLLTLQHKWRSRNVRLNEKLMKLQPVASTSHTPKNRHKHDLEFIAQLTQNNSLTNEQLLCFAPPKGTPIYRPMVNLSEFLSSYKICLNSYEERIGVVRRGETLCAEKVTRIKEMLKSNSKRLRHDSEKAASLEKKSPDGPGYTNKRMKADDVTKIHENESAVSSDREFGVDKVKGEEIVESLGLLGVQALKMDDSNDNLTVPITVGKAPDSTDSESEQQKSSNVEDFMIFKLLTSSNSNDAVKEEPTTSCESTVVATNNIKSICDSSIVINNNNVSVKPTEAVAVAVTPTPSVRCPKRKDRARKNKEFKPLVNEETIQKIREGWTLTNVGDLTVGDLYVMFGKDLKLTLDYKWLEEPKPAESPTAGEGTEEVTPNKVPAKSKSKKMTERARLLAAKRPADSVSSRLKQLLMIASLSEKMKRKPNSCICSNGIGKKVDDMGLRLADGVFKQPAIPMRNSSAYYYDNYRPHSNNMKYKQSVKWFNNRSPRKPLGLKILPLIKTIPTRTSDKQTATASTSTSTTGDIVPVTAVATSTTRDHLDSNSCFYEKAMECEQTEVVGHSTEDSFVTNALEERIYRLQDRMTISAIDGSSKTVEDFDDTSIKRLLYDSSSNLSYPAMYDLSYPSSPAMSPMRILRESPVIDSRSSVAVHDVSLNSFLGHLDAACDGNLKTITRNCSQEQMSSNLSVISETSVDFIAKFEDIAAELRASENMS